MREEQDIMTTQQLTVSLSELNEAVTSLKNELAQNERINNWLQAQIIELRTALRELT